MDMIGGRNTAEAGVLLEGAEVSQDVIDALARAAATYTDLVVTQKPAPRSTATTSRSSTRASPRC